MNVSKYREKVTNNYEANVKVLTKWLEDNVLRIDCIESHKCRNLIKAHNE